MQRDDIPTAHNISSRMHSALVQHRPTDDGTKRKEWPNHPSNSLRLPRTKYIAHLQGSQMMLYGSERIVSSSYRFVHFIYMHAKYIYGATTISSIKVFTASSLTMRNYTVLIQNNHFSNRAQKTHATWRPDARDREAVRPMISTLRNVDSKRQASIYLTKLCLPAYSNSSEHTRQWSYFLNTLLTTHNNTPLPYHSLCFELKSHCHSTVVPWFMFERFKFDSIS